MPSNGFSNREESPGAGPRHTGLQKGHGEQERESAEDFVNARRKHSAVESAINALEVHGLDKCPDHGIDGFKRYVALGIVARNIHKLGAVVKKLDYQSYTEFEQAA